MNKAIGIRLHDITGSAEPDCSKFFGSPAVPSEWLDSGVLGDDTIFLCQIRCEDTAELDPENALPHTGYLYFFLDVSEYPYRPLVLHTEKQPDTIIDDFNESVEGYEHLTHEMKMSFEPAELSAGGMKLLGTPADWSYGEPYPKVLLQYDPLEADLGFLDEIDGYAYFLFKENGGLSDIEFIVERS